MPELREQSTQETNVGNEQKGRRPNRERPSKGATPREGERRERELEWHLESVVQYATD